METTEQRSGWRTWRTIFGVLLGIPLLVAALWVLGRTGTWLVPGCRIGPSDGSCAIGFVDLEIPLAIVSFPAMIFAFLIPFWLFLTVAWLLYGIVPATIFWLLGYGFKLPAAFMLQGKAMKIPRIMAIAALSVLYCWWWVATL